MKKVLGLVHGELSSHTVRIVEIAKALNKTGDFHIVFSGMGPFMKFAEDAGFECIRTQTIPKEKLFGKVSRNLAYQVFNRYNFEYFYSAENNLLMHHRPDIIIRDLFREFAGVSAKKPGRRVYDVFVQRSPLCPYYHFDFRPDEIPDWIDKISPPGSLKRVAPLFENFYRKKNSKFIRRKLKQLRLKSYISIEGVKPDLRLFPDAEALYSLPESEPTTSKHIGPILVGDDSDGPKWLSKFKKDSRKKIVISKGSTGENEISDLFGRAFNDDKYAVALYLNEPKKIDNLFGCEQFNVSKVLPHADLFITHGGTGSTYLGLKHKIPMLALYDHVEQQTNAYQLEKNCAASKLGSKDLSVEELKQTVDGMFADYDKFKAGAGELSDKINFDNSLDLAVHYILNGYENFLQNKER